jgi:hypothetical protein
MDNEKTSLSDSELDDVSGGTIYTTTTLYAPPMNQGESNLSYLQRCVNSVKTTRTQS